MLKTSFASPGSASTVCPFFTKTLLSRVKSSTLGGFTKRNAAETHNVNTFCVSSCSCRVWNNSDGIHLVCLLENKLHLVISGAVCVVFISFISTFFFFFFFPRARIHGGFKGVIVIYNCLQQRLFTLFFFHSILILLILTILSRACPARPAVRSVVHKLQRAHSLMCDYQRTREIAAIKHLEEARRSWATTQVSILGLCIRRPGKKRKVKKRSLFAPVMRAPCC